VAGPESASEFNGVFRFGVERLSRSSPSAWRRTDELLGVESVHVLDGTTRDDATVALDVGTKPAPVALRAASWRSATP
jgi:hypothetical protein